MTLEIMKNGAKNWRVRFTFNGKPGLLSLGTYPKVSIAEARIKRDEVFDQIKNGINPSTAEKKRSRKPRPPPTTPLKPSPWSGWSVILLEQKPPPTRTAGCWALPSMLW